MTSHPPQRSFPVRWMLASTLGWLLGFVVIIALSLMWGALGGEAQFMVGVGMGAGVGALQARVLRPWLGGITPWLLTSTVGMGAPFILGDLRPLVGLGGISYSLPAYVLVGGGLVAILQGRLLRRHLGRQGWWVLACFVGWAIPAGLIGLGDMDVELEMVRTVASMVGMFLGGIFLGAVTAKPLHDVVAGSHTS